MIKDNLTKNIVINKTKTFIRKNWHWLFFLFVYLAILLIPDSPFYKHFPGRDSANYIYFAERILDGAIPYRDLWNHKGPAIYYTNVLGVLLTPSSFWGIWFLEFVFLYASMILAYFSLAKVYSRFAAFSGILIGFSISPKVQIPRNTNEVYALLPIFLALFLFIQGQDSKKYKLRYFLIGVFFAWSFLYRANNIGFFLALFSLVALQTWVLKNWREGLTKILWGFLGFVSLNMVPIIYFAMNDALYDYIDVAYLYNFLYSSSHGSLSKGLTSGIIATFPAIFLVSETFSLLLKNVFQAQTFDFKNREFIFKLLILFSVLAEIILSPLSGRGFGHYYIMWIPMIILSSTYLFYRISKINLSDLQFLRFQIPLSTLVTSLIFVIVLTPALYNQIQPTANFLKLAWEEKGIPIPPSGALNEQVTSVIRTIDHNPETSSNPYLIVWGFEPVYYLVNDKIAPTRWHFQYGLINPNYVTEDMLLEFYDDIREHHPLILDSSVAFSSVPWSGHKYWTETPTRKLIVDYIKENYVQLDPIGPYGFLLYVPIDKTPDN